MLASQASRSARRIVLAQSRRRLYSTTATATNSSSSRYQWFAMGGLTSAAALGAVNYFYNDKSNNTNIVQQQAKRPEEQNKTAVQKAFYELQELLPAEHVTVDEETLKLHGYSDNSYHNEGVPNIVVFPRNTEEVSHIVKIANKWDIPIIAFSGGTSLEGHFTAPHGGICISFTEHMDQVVQFHPDDLDIVVQPGIQWEDLNAQLKEHGLFFPMDPGPG